MTFKFNCITDDGAIGLREFYQPIIDKNEAGHFRYEAEAAIAFLDWRDGHRDSSLSHFKNAASLVVASLSTNASEQEPHNINAMLTPLLLVIAFGQQEQLEKLAKIKKSRWFFPEEREFIALAEFLEFLLQVLVSGECYLEKLTRMEKINQEDAANNFYRPWILAAIHAIAGLFQNNEVAVTDGINKLLTLHDRETDEGVLRKRVEGIICLWALAVFRLAKILNISISIQSPYIPNIL
jgi:hypothetical protein